MNISKRDAKLLLILLGIVIFLAGYFAVFNKYNTRTDTVKGEISALQPELEELRAHYASLNEYYAGIDSAQEEIARDTRDYPSDVRSEDIIMYAIELEEEVGINILGLAYTRSDPLTVMQIAGGEPDALTTREISAYTGSLSATCTLSYDQLKKLLEHISEAEDRTALDVISVGFDASSGELSSTLSVDKYFLRSGDEEYSPTEVPNVKIGTEDLFGTFRAAEEAKLEGEELEIPE